MQTKFWLGIACLWGVSACGHAPPVTSMSAARPPAPATTMPVQGPHTVFSYLDAYAAGERPQDARRLRVALVAPLSDVGAAHDAHERASKSGDPIARFVLTRGIENQKPMDEARTFKPGERVYAFVEVANPDGEKFALNLRWADEHQDIGQRTAVNIGASKRWRAWSSHRAPEQPGSYRCVVETHDGRPVAEIPFRVEI